MSSTAKLVSFGDTIAHIGIRVVRTQEFWSILKPLEELKGATSEQYTEPRAHPIVGLPYIANVSCLLQSQQEHCPLLYILQVKGAYGPVHYLYYIPIYCGFKSLDQLHKIVSPSFSVIVTS